MPQDRQDIVEGVSSDAARANEASSQGAAVLDAVPYTSVEELGAALGSLRKARGLSINDVAEDLRLAEPVIEAMESGEIARQKPAIYVKGFLRSYAQAMHMHKDLYEPLLSSLAEDRSALERPYFTPDKTARLPHSSPVWGILASLLVTVCAVWLLWHFNVIDHIFKVKDTVTPTAVPVQNYETAAREPAPQAGTAPGQPANTEQPAKTEQPVQGSEVTGTILRGDMQKPVGQEALPGGSGKTTPSGSPSQSLAPDRPETDQEYLPAVVPPNSPWAALQGNATLAGEAGMATQAPAAASDNPNLPQSVPGMPQDGKHVVTIMADSLCWTQVTADSGRPAQRTLQAGESMSVPFETSLTLRLGNAGGVKVYYDGIEQTDRGRVGQVRTLNFPPAPVE
ncbi:MAG: DUF4115 domain-containing protein [Desulfovibrionaceae bacterium]|nr:DUF4115 domain-containing protein [Desulfovibrionaceae bacterium]